MKFFIILLSFLIIFHFSHGFSQSQAQELGKVSKTKDCIKAVHDLHNAKKAWEKCHKEHKDKCADLYKALEKALEESKKCVKVENIDFHADGRHSDSLELIEDR